MAKFILSKGNSKAFIDLLDNLLIPQGAIIPPVEILSKIVESKHLKDFNEENHNVLKGKKGYYSDLQSINSEDAITWSFFGYISKSSNTMRLKFFNEFLRKIGFQEDSYCEIKLWQRLPHPETFGSGGPEIDVLLIGKKYFIIVECKWKSTFGKYQGINKNQDQMEIRQKWIDNIGKKIYPDYIFQLVYVGRHKNTNYKSVTWDELSNFKHIAGEHKNKFKKYLELK